MKTPLVSFEFTVTLEHLNLRRASTGEPPLPSDGPWSARLRVVSSDGGAFQNAYVRKTDRLGDAYWEMIDDINHADGPSRSPHFYSLNHEEVVGICLQRLAELALERVPTRIAGEATVLDLGVP